MTARDTALTLTAPWHVVERDGDLHVEALPDGPHVCLVGRATWSGVRETAQRIVDDHGRALAVVDALLRGAPCGYVPVPVVQRCLDAVDEWERERSAPVARTVARAAMVAARTALDAALAAATTTPKESP